MNSTNIFFVYLRAAEQVENIQQYVYAYVRIQQTNSELEDDKSSAVVVHIDLLLRIFVLKSLDYSFQQL